MEIHVEKQSVDPDSDRMIRFSFLKKQGKRRRKKKKGRGNGTISKRSSGGRAGKFR